MRQLVVFQCRPVSPSPVYPAGRVGTPADRLLPAGHGHPGEQAGVDGGGRGVHAARDAARAAGRGHGQPGASPRQVRAGPTHLRSRLPPAVSNRAHRARVRVKCTRAHTRSTHAPHCAGSLSRFYLGLRHKRVRGEQYDDLMDEFIDACQKRFGEQARREHTAMKKWRIAIRVWHGATEKGP